MPSKSMGPEGPAIPHLSKGENADLRGDIDSAFLRNEARASADGFPRIDKVNKISVSVAGANQDFVVTGVGLGTASEDISATVGGLDMVVQVAPADITVTLRLASGAGLVIGDTAALHMTVDGVAALPVSFEVVV